MNARCANADDELNGLAETGSSSSSSLTTIAVGTTISLGARARLVALADGLAIEAMNGAGAWVRQVAWEEA